MHLTLLFLTLFCICASKQEYIAAVYNHAPRGLGESNPELTIDKNIQDFEEKITRAKALNVSIIVFPEYGLTGRVTDPTEYAIYLNGTYPYSESILRHFSDAATEHGMYIVINLLEKDQPTNQNKTLYYNTNIVFDGDGKIIAKYRKINLHDEEKLTPGETATTFSALGLTFGLISGFDIVHDNPAQEVLRKGATEIIMPTALPSTTPFFASTSVQQGYAASNRVNLLAAGYDDPGKSNGGSGIYSYLTSEVRIYPSRTSELITSQLTKADRTPRKCDGKPIVRPYSTSPFGLNPPVSISSYVTEKQFHGDRYQFHDLELSNAVPINVENLCHNKLCCDFTISAANVNPSETYKVMVYNGKEDFYGSSQSMQICSLLICNNDKNSCGDRLNGNTTFTTITIKAHFPGGNTKMIYQPTSLTINLLPALDTAFCLIPNDKNLLAEYYLQVPIKGVVNFGIVGLNGGDGSSALPLMVPSFFIGFITLLLRVL